MLFRSHKCHADYITTSYKDLLSRPEVNAVIVCTDEHLHVDPVIMAAERNLPLLIEKPLATDLAESEQTLAAIEKAGVDAVIGYTQRFRRRWLVAKEKVRNGSLGEVTMVTSRAFMNRLVAIDNYKRSDNRAEVTPMVISGTHALDIVMWLMEAKTPVEVYARSVNKALGKDWQGVDGTGYTISFDDGAIYHGVISWALPEIWPGAVYSLEVGAVGTTPVWQVCLGGLGQS